MLAPQTNLNLAPGPQPNVLFVDMNSFFATCEQQDNYVLRGRPVGVCVYTSTPKGCIISPSIEAKKKGVKTGMLLSEAMLLCPNLIPVETHPTRYRTYHQRVLAVLQQFSDVVIPKSIDEAVVDLRHHTALRCHDVVAEAQNIKQAIRAQAGDYLRCSVGIAPNAYLAKLGTELQKPDGLVIITPQNIDEKLKTLRLIDLPGIGHRMAQRLQDQGVLTPLQMRHTSAERLRAIFKSVVGVHWHMRLNFGGEVDMETHATKQMQAIRSVSGEQRASVQTLDELLRSLCLKLEQRLVRQNLFCKRFSGWVRYWNGERYDDEITVSVPMQDGLEIYGVLKQRMARYAQVHGGQPVITNNVRQLGVGVTEFIAGNQVQYTLFEDHSRKDKLRQIMYALRDRYGPDKIGRAADLFQQTAFKDLIGFGSIRDMQVKKTDADEEGYAPWWTDDTW